MTSVEGHIVITTCQEVAVGLSLVICGRAGRRAVHWLAAFVVLATVVPAWASDAGGSGVGDGVSGPPSVSSAPRRVADGGGSVDDAGVHQPSVDALRDSFPKVFDGTGCDGDLCAREPLQRWEMAVWLVRVLDRRDTPSGGGSRFADVDAGLWWAPYTDRLADLAVTAGCATGPLRFCPHDSVTRGQMASFLVRAFDLDAGPAAGFTDVGRGVHAASIDAVAAAGITAGCKARPLRYCPFDAVTRGQMATFLARALGLVPLPGVESAVPLIAYTATAAGQSTIVVVDAEGGNERRVATGGSDPIWSPDGSRILYTGDSRPGSGNGSGTAELWVMDADGTNRRRLATGDGHGGWSPDSSRIVYRSDGLWVVGADGTGRTRLVAGNAWSPVWSPDSSRVVYRDGANPYYMSGDNLFVTDMDGNRRQITSDGGRGPVWSPDGSRVYYESDDEALMAVDAGGSDRRTLASAVRQKVLSPDGTHLAYVPSGGGIWIVGVDGDGRQQLTGPGYWRPRWSPHSSHLSATWHDFEGWPLGLVIVDTGGATLAEITPGGVFDPAWLPDGQGVVYTRSASGVESDIHLLGVDGTGRQLTHDQTEKDCLTVSPDGRHIAYRASDAVYTLDMAGTSHLRLYRDGPCPRWSPV